MNEYKIPDELKSNLNFTVDASNIGEQFWIAESSEWKCHLFGYVKNSGITYTPKKGEEPNWFWRMTQHLILGHKWVKEQDND
tara:strand:- start:22 stop:267 length:246 start_codon:yes stop_codon:yes gene_type:complete